MSHRLGSYSIPYTVMRARCESLANYKVRNVLRRQTRSILIAVVAKQPSKRTHEHKHISFAIHHLADVGGTSIEAVSGIIDCLLDVGLSSRITSYVNDRTSIIHSNLAGKAASMQQTR
jgi:hypothetical protein